MKSELALSAQVRRAASDPPAGSRPTPAPARWPGLGRRRGPALTAAGRTPAALTAVATAVFAAVAVTGWADPGRPPDDAADSAARCVRVLGAALGVESRVESAVAAGEITASARGPAPHAGEGPEETSRSLAGFASAVRALGVPAAVTELSLDRLESVGFPAVAYISEGDVAERRWVVVWDARDDAILVADSAARWIPRESLHGVRFLGGVTVGERPLVPRPTAWVLAAFGAALVAGGAARAVLRRRRPAPAALFASAEPATGTAAAGAPGAAPTTPPRADPDVAARTAVRPPPADTLAHK